METILDTALFWLSDGRPLAALPTDVLVHRVVDALTAGFSSPNLPIADVTAIMVRGRWNPTVTDEQLLMSVRDSMTSRQDDQPAEPRTTLLSRDDADDLMPTAQPLDH